MTQEEKQLLFKDLCARLPYGVIVHRYSDNCYSDKCDISIDNVDDFVYFLEYSEGEEFKPYLRPMGSMTEEEKEELYQKTGFKVDDYILGLSAIDWLNAHHFDYRSLIEKGLALEAPEGMYKMNKV